MYPMKYIDAHSHIDYLTHQHQDDVEGEICCTTNESQWQILVDTMKRDGEVYGAFGIHPWFGDSVTDGFETRLEQLLQTDSRYMVGEIGLDKYKPDMDKQIEVFIKQIELAVKLKRSLVLHCVGAWDKILHIFKQYKIKDLPFIIAHSFNGNDKILEQLMCYDNIMFSFGNNYMSGDFCCIDKIPLNKILVETDGKSDIMLYEVVDKISKLKNEPGLAKVIYNNTKKIIANE